MSSKLKVTIKNFSFIKWIGKIENSGARLLGFCGFTIVVDGMEFTYSDLKVRVNGKGEYHLRAPLRTYKTTKTESGYGSTPAYRFDEKTYAALRKFVYGQDAVKEALAEDSEKEIPLSA